MNRLMLCAGTTKREGWKTLDTNGKSNPDYWFHIPPLPRVVTDQKWDEIELIHGITSFYPWEAEQLLREIHGVLTDGGILVLEQPDLGYILSAARFNINWVFGDPRFKNPAHMNKWAYTMKGLTSIVQNVGFKVSQIEPAQYHDLQRDFRLVAKK